MLSHSNSFETILFSKEDNFYYGIISSYPIYTVDSV